MLLGYGMHRERNRQTKPDTNIPGGRLNSRYGIDGRNKHDSSDVVGLARQR